MLPSDLNFGAPLWLWALLVVPALAALFFRAERQSARRLAKLIQAPRLRQQLAGVANALRRRLRYAFLLLGLTGLILTAAQPRWGYETRETHRRGLDLVVIADVSKSMLATDIVPDRLTREKLAIDDLICQLQGDRVGLVAFAGSAFLQAPLTIDYDAVLGSVAELDTELIPRGGTNLGGAIDLALEAFGKNEAGNRAIVLLSDGEATVEGEQASGVEAAKRAVTAGARVFTVGFGTPEGSLIPLPGGRKGDFVRDEDGKIVRSRLDEAALNEIARAGNGSYLRFTSGEATMRTLIQDGLSQLKAGEIDARTARRPIERYQWPLAFALTCIVLSILLGERRRRGAPAAIDGISPDTIAVPVRRMGTPAKATAAVAAFLSLWCAAPLARADDAGKPADNPPSDRPLELYRDHRYDEAYHAYEDLAKKDPKADDLQFNAGASAYMGKQYDEAMDAFGKALTSDDAALRARSHYNFGNTLFRRGEEQKDPKARLADWRNALQHYDSTMDVLKRADPARRDPALEANTRYNRGFVQKLVEEEERKQPPPQQKQDKDKNQDKDKQDQKQGKSQGGPQDQSKQDQSGGKQQQQQPSSQDQKGSSSSQDQDGSGSQQPKPDGQEQGGKEANQPPPGGQSGEQKDGSKGNDKKDGNQPPSNPSEGDGKQSDSHPADASARNGQPHDPADPSNLPDQSKPRQHGDFNAQPAQGQETPPAQKEGEAGQEAGESPEQAGKMSQAQAEALLNALKGDDAHVGLDPNNKHRRDEPVAKDW